MIIGLKKFFENMWLRAMERNHQNIIMLMDKNTNAKLLDLGCDDGKVTLKFGGAVGTDNMYGVDINQEKLNLAQNRGVTCFKADICKGLPFEDNIFDLVHANQVIEHVSNVDLFLSEAFRVLKKGGYLIVSTENGSSWVNIFAAIMGWQIFSLTNVSGMSSGVGNPLALHRGESPPAAGWTHKTIFNYQGLKEIFELHGFAVERILGAGYFPFPDFLARIDVRHSHFITIRARKREF